MELHSSLPEPEVLSNGVIIETAYSFVVLRLETVMLASET